MHVLRCWILIAAAASLLPGSLIAQRKESEINPRRGYRPPAIKTSPELQAVLRASIDEVLSALGASRFHRDNIAATLIDVRDPSNIRQADVEGDRPIYPASVVKLFYMAALQRQLENGEVTITPELKRGLRDMIVDSSNDATHYIVDVLTGTASGPEIPKKNFAAWQHKRNRVNRYFAAMGYEGINVNQKTYCEDAYGIEQQSRNYKGENRNMLTTNATARLLSEIVLGKMANPQATNHMMELLKRDPFGGSSQDDADDQASGFIGRALNDKKIVGAKLWSKAGWTSDVRHDAAYVETADGLKFVLVIFTEKHAAERDAIPRIAMVIIERLRKMKRSESY